MNKRQREVELYKLDQESAVLKQLERQYRLALEDVQLTIRLLQADEQTQSKIHRINYQKKLEKQLEGALEKLHMSEYKSISKYLNDSYNTGFVGTMYDLHGQGIPIIAPIDQNAAVKAIQLDTKLSDRKIHESLNGELVTLYESLGVDVDDLKKTIRKEITRGIASGMKYDDIARNISFVSKAPLSRAKTIVRTEGHRIQQQSAEDARQTAKAKGAGVVKQWDSTMDGATRPNHRTLDGKIVEVNERFKIGKFEPRFPGDFGDPAEDCNCRCVALTRARRSLDAAELETLKERAAYFKLDKSEDFADFEKKYLNAVITPANTTKPLKNQGKSGIIKAGNTEVRKWYLDAVSHIPDSIEQSLPMVEKAKKAFEARNRIRTEARDMMADEVTRLRLDQERPNKTFEELIKSKMERKGMTRTEAIEDIYKTATKTNANVNKELGLED